MSISLLTPKKTRKLFKWPKEAHVFSGVLFCKIEEMAFCKEVAITIYTKCDKNKSYILNCHLYGESELKKVVMVAPSGLYVSFSDTISDDYSLGRPYFDWFGFFV